jgi:hypothetical protein
MLTIKGTITPEAQNVELLAGRPAQLDREFTSDDVGLVARALALGASIDTAGNVSLPPNGYSNATTVSRFPWSRVPTDAADAISLWEAAVEAKRAELAVEAAKAAAREAERLAERMAHFEEWLAQPEPTPENPGPSSPWRDTTDFPEELCNRITARDALKATAEKEIQRRRDADKAENEAAARYRAKARLEILAQLCVDWGDESVKERLAQRNLPDGNPLGLLPEAEAVAVVTDWLLPLSADLAPYIKIQARDVRQHCDVDADYSPVHQDFAFVALDADDFDVGGLSPDEWATVKGITTAVNKIFEADFFRSATVECAVEPRVHRGQCRERECPEWPVRRVGVLVRVTIDNVLTVEREYGASE